MKTRNNNKTNFPTNNKDTNTVIATKTEHYAEPLPPASEFAKYKEIIPDMPERIIYILKNIAIKEKTVKEIFFDSFSCFHIVLCKNDIACTQKRCHNIN